MAGSDDVNNVHLFRYGLPAEATLNDKQTFATHCRQNCRVQEWSGGSLSEYFADDYNEFTPDDVKAIYSNTCKNLRDLFRSRGIFVTKGRNVLITDALYRVAEEDLAWREDDSDKPIKQNTKFFSPHKYQPNSGRPVSDHVGLDKPVIRNKYAPVLTYHRLAEPCTENNRPWKRSNMANLLKAYTVDADKYSRATTYNLEHKFMLFLERCEQADILNEDRYCVFYIMLTGHAR